MKYDDTKQREAFETLALSRNMNVNKHTVTNINLTTGEAIKGWHYNTATTQKAWVWFEAGYVTRHNEE